MKHLVCPTCWRRIENPNAHGWLPLSTTASTGDWASPEVHRLIEQCAVSWRPYRWAGDVNPSGVFQVHEWAYVEPWVHFLALERKPKRAWTKQHKRCLRRALLKHKQDREACKLLVATAVLRGTKLGHSCEGWLRCVDSLPHL